MEVVVGIFPAVSWFAIFAITAGILLFILFLAEYVFYGNNFVGFKFVVVLDLYSCNWVLLH